MAVRHSNFYSRFVAWSKIILPLLAIAILSSLFLFSKSHNPAAGMRMFKGSLADFASQERITAPRISGMTPSGAAIQLSAKEGVPRRDNPSAFDATGLTARIELPDGALVNVIAARGSVDSRAGQADLNGGITLTTSGGYTAKTKGLIFALNVVDIRSDGTILAAGPLGNIKAGGLHLKLADTNTTDAQPSYVLMFNNRVKLIYNPGK